MECHMLIKEPRSNTFTVNLPEMDCDYWPGNEIVSPIQHIGGVTQFIGHGVVESRLLNVSCGYKEATVELTIRNSWVEIRTNQYDLVVVL
jgi:hypothetical protein